MDAAELRSLPNGVIPPTSRLPLGRGSMHCSATRLATVSASSFVLLAAIAVACCSGGCSRGAHAEAASKPKPREPETMRAAVLVVEAANWPAVVRTQGSLIADEMTIVGAKVAG